jgi:hypothetical protein
MIELRMEHNYDFYQSTKSLDRLDKDQIERNKKRENRRLERWSCSDGSTIRYSPIIDACKSPKSLRKSLQLDEIATGFEFGDSRFVLIRKIGNGSYGDIWLGTNKESGEDVAVKIELKNRTMLQLPLEQKIYQILNNGVGAAGFPKALFYGEGQLVNILVMELLGSTLEDLFRYCNKQFSLKTVIMLFDQLLSRIGMSY